MKKLILLICAAAVLMLSACAANENCTYEKTMESLASADEVYAYIYADEKGYDIEAEPILEMISGEWTESQKTKTGTEKILSVTVGTQYEICLFADGSAMIYCGYAEVYEKDRAFYKYELEGELEEICDYIRENGEEVALEDDNAAPAAE